MKTSITNNLWAVLFGVIGTLTVSLALCALGAALLGSGVLPISTAAVSYTHLGSRSDFSSSPPM